MRTPLPHLLAVALASVTVAVVPVTAGSAGAASPGDVVINEILYHPEDDHPDGEFLELLNLTGSPIDVGGWCVDGIDFCFPGGRVVPANGFLVTTSAEWGGALSNGGEDLALIDAGGTTIEAFEYDDKKQWPANTDGNGASLQRRRATADPADPGNWYGGTPTPGAANVSLGAPFILVDDAEHTESPAAGAPIQVTAVAPGATSARIEYLVGFGPVQSIVATVSGDEVSATIPGQAAGSLVRYRWVVQRPGRVGTWPRQGDGMKYTGTVVASPSPSPLPRFQWFMEDSVYEAMRNDLTLRGDEGYPAVFAYDGEVFDNTLVRVKGQTSRFWTKKKFKFILPNGHDVEIDGFTEEDVDEFALHSSWSDKSFAREILSAEFLDEVGLPVSQSFPVRLERNGQFFGLYTYIEQRDGTFRDRNEFGDATVYEVGGNVGFGDMQPSHVTASESRLRQLYDKDTNEWENDDELRELIRLMNLPLTQRPAVLRERVDESTIINSIAASMVIQHQDFGLKNYDLRLTDQGLWAISPTDFDLTWGRRGLLTCGSLCDVVGIGGAFEHPGTPLFAAFWFNPYYADKIRQRIRTLVDEHFEPGRWSQRVIDLRNLMSLDAAADRSVWGTYGTQQDPGAAANQITTSFINPQHARLSGTMIAQGRVSSIGQPADARVAITDVGYDGTDVDPAYVVLTNLEGIPIDISGFEIEELDYVATGGTILNPGESAIAVHEDADSIRGRFPNHVFAGLLGEEPKDAVDGFHLTDRQGDRLASRTELVPGEVTTFEGRPGASAFLNIVATSTNRPGFLQVIDCADQPGATSNLNIDGRSQTRAVAAVAQFDADGKLCVFNLSATHIVVDIAGYFEPSAIDDIADVRLFDSRDRGRPVGEGEIVRLSGRPDSSAILNLVGIRPSRPGYLRLVPCDTGEGEISNVTLDGPGQVRAGLAVGRFDANGELCVFSLRSTHVVVDLQAYLADAAVDDVDDERLLDTRATPGKPGDGATVRFAGRANTSAFVGLTVTQAMGPGFVQLVPCAGGAETSSNINFDRPGQTISNLAVAEFDANGEACLFVRTGAHVIVDLQSYLADSAFDDIADTRLLDSRRR